jgi:hypothetical protein
VETKPYRIQSPEDIAKDYGGNKQKIAQAMQMGVVDPTAGVLAGMFIDRMRSAQVQEMAPQLSVAQQVMGGAPQAPGAVPPGGLGMTPPAPPPMAPGMAPPMGDMPMGAPPAPPMGDMPMGAPPMGMADGGLAMLPIPETMFDEPMDGEYADGGIVSFAQGEEVQQGSEDPEVDVFAGRYGLYPTFEGNMGLIDKYAPQQSKYGDKLTSFYEAEMSPEAQKKRGKQDLNSFLMSFGAKLASTRGPLLSAVGEAASATLPGLQEAAKARRAEQRDAIKTLAAREDMTNKQVTEAFRLANEMQKAYGGFMDTKAQRNLTREMNEADNETQILAQQIATQGQKDVAGTYARAQEGSNPLKLAADIQGKIQAEAQDAVNKAMENELPAFTPEQKAAQDARRQQLFNMEVAKRSQAYAAANPLFAQMLGIAPGAGASNGQIVVKNGKRFYQPGG